MGEISGKSSRPGAGKKRGAMVTSILTGEFFVSVHSLFRSWYALFNGKYCMFCSLSLDHWIVMKMSLILCLDFLPYPL